MSEIRGVDGMSRPLEATDIRGLAGTLSGPVLQPVDPGYDDSRRIFNGMIDRRPALIARGVRRRPRGVGAPTPRVPVAMRIARTRSVSVTPSRIAACARS